MKKAAAAEDLSAKKELALQVIDRLKTEYPDAACTLDYDHAWQLLVSVRLAAQCTDARVNIVVQDLFAKYPNVAALAAAEPEEIEAIVKPCGLGRSKARDISACMRVLRDKYNCKVPTTFEELLALPGVGAETADVILVYAFYKPSFILDAYTRRWLTRLGFDADDDGRRLFFESGLPRDAALYGRFHWLILDHCIARCRKTPCCAGCPFADECKAPNPNV